MSKYNVFIDDYGKAEHWYSIKEQMHYYFFNKGYEEKHLEGEAVKHLMDVTKGKIKNDKGIDFEFGIFTLEGTRRRYVDGKYTMAEKHGYALRTRHSMTDRYANWPTKEIEGILSEPVLERRDWNTVIAIKVEGGGRFSRKEDTFGENNDFDGNISLNMEYTVYKRHKHDSNDRRYSRQSEWDYYSLHDGNIDQVPHEDDRTHIDEEDYVCIIPYTEAAHEALKKICGAGQKLGEDLRKLFNTGKFLKNVSMMLTFKQEKKK